MSFSTDYTSFGNSLAAWLTDQDSSTITDIGVNLTADLISIGETRIFREVRTRDMETAFSDTITAGMLALPASYLALKSAYLDASPNVSLERRSAEWIRLSYPQSTTSGIPKFIARYGTNFIFGPYPDSNYSILGVYYKNIGPLSSSAHTLFTNNPDLYLFASLAAAAPYLKDDKRVLLWEAQYKSALLDAQKQSDDEEGSGDALEIRAA